MSNRTDIYVEKSLDDFAFSASGSVFYDLYLWMEEHSVHSPVRRRAQRDGLIRINNILDFYERFFNDACYMITLACHDDYPYLCLEEYISKMHLHAMQLDRDIAVTVCVLMKMISVPSEKLKRFYKALLLRASLVELDIVNIINNKTYTPIHPSFFAPKSTMTIPEAEELARLENKRTVVESVTTQGGTSTTTFRVMRKNELEDDNAETVKLKRKGQKGETVTKEITVQEIVDVVHKYPYASGLTKSQMANMLAEITDFSASSFQNRLKSKK